MQNPVARRTGVVTRFARTPSLWVTPYTWNSFLEQRRTGGRQNSGSLEETPFHLSNRSDFPTCQTLSEMGKKGALEVVMRGKIGLPSTQRHLRFAVWVIDPVSPVNAIEGIPDRRKLAPSLAYSGSKSPSSISIDTPCSRNLMESSNRVFPSLRITVPS
jgi:hypothetical protein